MAKKRNMLLAPFIQALRTEGWTQRYDSKGGGCRTVEFYKFFGQREVQVQLWGNGMHRATNMLYSDRAKTRGRMCTMPTSFMRDIKEMWNAVDWERRRKDHPPVTVANVRGCNA